MKNSKVIENQIRFAIIGILEKTTPYFRDFEKLNLEPVEILLIKDYLQVLGSLHRELKKQIEESYE